MTKSDQKQIVKKLVKAYENINVSRVTRGQAFGIVINSVNTKGETLKDKHGNDIAIEITAKVLSKLGYPKYNKAIVNF